ncbi:MAG: hypothetical protein AAGK01_03180 [Pseudomonadota bacterium]
MIDNILAFPLHRSSALRVPASPVGSTGVDPRVIGLRKLTRHLLITPKKDWELACRVIAVDGCASLQAYAGAVLGALDAFGTHQTVFFELPAREMSDGEKWFAAVFAALDQGDEPSFAALVGFGASRRGRRRLAFLLAGLHRAFADPDCCCVAGLGKVDEFDEAG